MATSTPWRNPAGRIFRVVCYKEAPGTHAAGAPTDDFTWFRGYEWQFAGCQGCATHLGWQFSGGEAPAVFFGLINPKLSTKRT